MVEPFIKELVDRGSTLSRGDTDVQRTYENIHINAAHDASSSHVWTRHKDALLPILVKDSFAGSVEVQLLALELLGHLAAMAEDTTSFELQQARSLWATVARVLQDEARGSKPKLMALMAIALQKMGPSLMEPCAPLLAPGIAKMMRHDSAVVREQAAAAAHCLVGDAPLAMKRCSSTCPDQEHEGDTWLASLLRLCLDDCVGVRAKALTAAKRTVSCLRREPSVAAWVLQRVMSGSLFEDMRRVLHRDSRGSAGTKPVQALQERQMPRSPPDKTSKLADTDEGRLPPAERVKHAMMAWAVHLSLADFGSLDKCRDVRGNAKNAFQACTDIFLEVSRKFKDRRPSVRMETMEAWGMFASTCLCDVNRHQAARVSELSVRPMIRAVLKERHPLVREAALSSLGHCLASFAPHSIKHLWRLPVKLGGSGKIGLADLLRKISGGDLGADAQFFCARTLAALLPCSSSPPVDARSRREQKAHPDLQQAGFAISVEASPILATLQTLLESFPAPTPDVASATVSTAMDNSEGTGSWTVLDALPMSQLIVRAWCGLARWSMSEASSGSAGMTGSQVGKSSPDEHREGKKQEGEVGHRMPSVCALSTMLDWLLSGLVPAHGEAEGGVSGVDVDTSREPKNKLQSWGLALVAGLVRMLAHKRLAESEHVSERVHCLEAWSQLSVDIPALSFSEGDALGERLCSGDCLDNAGTESILAWLKLEWCTTREDTDGTAEQTPQNMPVVRRRSSLPVWLVLVLGLLVGGCTQDDVRPHHAVNEHAKARTIEVSSGHEEAEAADGHGLSRHVPLSDAILTEALSLSPAKAPARLLARALRAFGARTASSGDGHAQDRVQVSRDVKRWEPLLFIARVWRAEASRVLFAWTACKASDGSGSKKRQAPAPLSEALGPLVPATSARMTDIEPRSEPDETLLDRTAAILRFLPQLARVTLRTSRATEGSSVAAGLEQEPATISSTYVEKIFGRQAAGLWRDVFAVRKAHAPGSSSLLRKLAEDFALLALASAPAAKAASQAGHLKDDTLTSGGHGDRGWMITNWGVTLTPSATETGDVAKEDARARGGAVAIAGERRPQDPCPRAVNGEHLAAPPPVGCVPIVLSAAMALLHDSLKEAGSTKTTAWAAGLASLAWVLTCTPHPGARLAQEKASDDPSITTGAELGGVSDVTGSVCSCLRSIRAWIRGGGEAKRRSASIVLDKESMVPLSRLIAVGVSRQIVPQVPPANAARSRLMSLAAAPRVWKEMKALVSCTLSNMKAFPQDALSSAGLLLALSPMLEALLDMTESSEADEIQSSLVETWNGIFGKLARGGEWEAALPASLRHLLARPAALSDMKSSAGMSFDNACGIESARDGREEGCEALRARNVDSVLRSQLGRHRLAKLSCARADAAGNVAGVLPAACAKRSFMRHTRNSPPGQASSAHKRSRSSFEGPVTAGSNKFLRVVGSGRASACARRPRRAAITTYTSLDGSQAPWEDGSQLPDTEPDSHAACSPVDSDDADDLEAHDGGQILSAEDQRLEATMAAIAKESSASFAEERDGESGSDDGQDDCHNVHTRCPQVFVAGDSVPGVLETTRRLARILDTAKSSMDAEQLKEMRSLLDHALRCVCND